MGSSGVLSSLSGNSRSTETVFEDESSSVSASTSSSTSSVFLELLSPLLNHVVRDDIEVLAGDSDSPRLHAGNNHGEGFSRAHKVVEEGAAFDHDAPCSTHLIWPRNDGWIQSWKRQVPTVVDAEAVGVEA
jgi:hypothetical protein